MNWGSTWRTCRTALAATDEGGKALNDWTLTLYFLTPASVKPVGIQVNADRELPRYALIKPV